MINDFDYIEEYEGYVLDRVDLVFLIEMLVYIVLTGFALVVLFGERGVFLAGVHILWAGAIILFYSYSKRHRLFSFLGPAVGVLGGAGLMVCFQTKISYIFTALFLCTFLFSFTYTFCCSFAYRNKARLGCVILPVPIVNLLSIFICRTIGALNDEDGRDDGFSQKIEGLIFTIYAKVLFYNEKEAKTLNHPEAYGLLYSYYERQGFRRGLIIDRCNEAIGDGVSIVQASSYMKKALVYYDKAKTINFVASLFRLIEPIHRPIKKQNDYTGIEKILSKVAGMFGLTKDEYYCIVEPFAQKLIKLDMNVAAHSEDFLRKVNEGVKNKKKNELYRITDSGTISDWQQQFEDNNYESGFNDENLMDEYYAILGCTPNASEKEIQSAYGKIIKESDSPKWDKKSAKERFVKIQEAYQKIKVAKGF